MWLSSAGTLDFSVMQRRVASPRTAARLAREQPASHAAFDVLARDGADLRARPHAERRAVRTELAGTWSPPMTLSPGTDDPDTAAAWSWDLASAVHGFGAGREPVTLTRIDPVVIEVSADVSWSGRLFRHALRYMRVRPELHPGEVSPPPTSA